MPQKVPFTGSPVRPHGSRCMMITEPMKRLEDSLLGKVYVESVPVSDVAADMLTLILQGSLSARVRADTVISSVFGPSAVLALGSGLQRSRLVRSSTTRPLRYSRSASTCEGLALLRVHCLGSGYHQYCIPTCPAK